MADTVVVLTKRPAQIKNIYKIKLTNASSPINNRNCPEFNDFYNDIWQEFDHEIS